MFEGTIVAARLLQFGSALVLFGAPLFYLYSFESAAGFHPPRWRWQSVIQIAAVAGALAGVIVWLLIQTIQIFDTLSTDSLRTVLTGTGFGRTAGIRIGLIVLALLLFLILPLGRSSWIAQALLGGAVVASFAWTGHGVRDDGAAGALHLGGDLLHLLGAGVWIGALVPLGLLVLSSLRTRSEKTAYFTYAALERFSGIGPGVVAVLILTGLINSWFLIGIDRPGALFTTLYGQLLLIKLVFFAGMLALATANRCRLSPDLGAALRNGEAMEIALRKLRQSVLSETALALLVLLAVSWFGTLEPPAGGG